MKFTSTIYIQHKPPGFQLYLCTAIDNSHFLIYSIFVQWLLCNIHIYTIHTLCVDSMFVARTRMNAHTFFIFLSFFLSFFFVYACMFVWSLCKILSYVIKWFIVMANWTRWEKGMLKIKFSHAFLCYTVPVNDINIKFHLFYHTFNWHSVWRKKIRSWTQMDGIGFNLVSTWC